MTLRILALVLTYLAVGFADAARGLSSLPAGAVLPSGAAPDALVWMGLLAALLVALPSGVLAAKTGKKSTILLGLCIAMVGDLVPVLAGSRAGDLLLATFLVGAGLTSAQVAGAAVAADAAGHRWPSWLLLAFAAMRAGAALAPAASQAAAGLGWHWTAFFGGLTIVVAIAFTAMVIGRIDERSEREGPVGAVFSETARMVLQLRTILFVLAVVSSSVVAGGLRAPSRDMAALVVLTLAAGALAAISARVVLQGIAALGTAAGALLLLAGPVGLLGTVASSVASGAFAAVAPLALVMFLKAQPGRTTLVAGLGTAAMAAGGACSVATSCLDPGPVVAGVLALLVTLWPPLAVAPTATPAVAEER